MSSRWPRAVIPFELNTKNGRLKKDAVIVAMKKIERDTCIRWCYEGNQEKLVIFTGLFLEKSAIENI